MADKTPDQLPAATSAADSDLLMIYPDPAGPLKKLTFGTFIAQVVSALSGTVLTVANNLSDLASAAAARANMGLGTASTLSASAIFQVANNGSEVANAATFRSNIGAAASSAPTITGGATFSGSTKQNVQALAALDIDVSLGEWFTKSISTGSTFTFSGVTASKAQGFLLELTISSAAVPAFPAAVEWANGYDPSAGLGNGTHWLAFFTANGGTSWVGRLVARNVS